MKKARSPNGANGERDAQGRFRQGCAGGPGNPHARRVARLRSALLEAVTEEDIAIAVQQLVTRAREGDLVAIRELLDRAIGRPATAIQTAEQAASGMINSAAERVAALVVRVAERVVGPDEARRLGAKLVEELVLGEGSEAE